MAENKKISGGMITSEEEKSGKAEESAEAAETNERAGEAAKSAKGKTKMISDANIHKGHRERLKRRFRAEGIGSFEDHNILELLLFFAIPLRDTNPTAHKLMRKFSSLNGVLEAPADALTKVDGVGENAATLISLVGQIASFCSRRKPSLELKRRYEYDRTGKYLTEIMSGLENEHVYAVFYDTRMEYIGEMTLHTGSVNGASFGYRKLSDAIALYGANYVVLAHNHPGGRHIPSRDDLATHQDLKRFLTNLRVGLIEHYIVAPTGYCGLEHLPE